MDRENLQELIGLIYDLNKSTDKDWFMDFSGHIDGVSVNYSYECKCGSCSNVERKAVYLSYVTQYKDIPELIKKLKSEFGA